MNSDTIVSEYISFSKQCINRYFKKILEENYHQEIVNILINNYIDSRYYSNSDNLPLTIRTNLNKAKASFKGADLQIADNVIKTFNFILYFDNVIECESSVKVVEAIANFRETVLSIKQNKSFNDSLLEMVKEDLIKKKEFLDSFDSDKFQFDCQLTNLDRVYDVSLNQSLKFPNVYSSRAIDKVFKSKDLAEKRSLVEYNYTALQVLRDLIQGNHYEYLVDYPSAISEKEEDFRKLFDVLDHEMLRKRISIKISFADFLKEKSKIYEYMREGFMFVACLDNSFIEDEANLNFLKIFKFIMVKRRNSFIDINNYKNVIKVE